LHAAFNQLFASSVGNTLVPAMHSVCKSTHRLAVAADREAASRDHAKLNNAALLLQESFSKTFNDRKEFRPDAPFDDEGSKKAGVLGIVNELFNIYFRLNTLRLCKNLAKPVEGRKLHLQGSMAQMVTYRYYTGRLNLFEDNYAEAEKNLEYALTNCHKDAVRNKRCILRYLIPVKLYRGKLPTAACKFMEVGCVR
jgi:nuclear mRNA export protein PCID2/THP1